MVITVNALDFNSELNKLNKQKLIDAIINKRVPNDIVLSDSIRKHINFWETVESHDAKEILDSNLETNITFIKTKSELSISNVKLEALEQRASDLNRIIEHQKRLIEMQDTSKTFNRNVNKPSPTQTYSAVVGLSSISCGSETLVSKPPKMLLLITKIC
ncbi:hypothetical protein HHI36_001507 [Cryptolaemus montrouzieri]|uniref:Uncharacterized protein n=1 Tax=Cryptolaemus montrouzieri TaxID=559131 RepID=A0ABD2P8I7_9CUCU